MVQQACQESTLGDIIPMRHQIACLRDLDFQHFYAPGQIGLEQVALRYRLWTRLCGLPHPEANNMGLILTNNYY